MEGTLSAAPPDRSPTASGRARLRRATGRAAALALAALLLAGLLPPSPALAAIRPRRVVGGLAFPAAFVIAPDGRIFYGERLTGRVRVYDPRTRSHRTFARVGHLLTQGERGLLGIALHPDYPAVPWVYAYVTRSVDGKPRNQILRWTDDGGRGSNPRAVFTSPVMPATNHQGGRILFGPDGFLYVVIGDGANPANAQDLDRVLGKVLRLTDDGRAAPGNPFGNRVFAYGIRNSYGLGFDPRTGRLWETDNGPECNDEVNRIVPGGNYAWGPRATCDTPPEPPRNTNRDGRARRLPERWYTPTIAPTGLAFCDRCGLHSPGRLFFGAWNTGEIRRLTLTTDRRGVRGQRVAYRHPRGVLSIEVDPHGRIYFSDPQGIYRLVWR